MSLGDTQSTTRFVRTPFIKLFFINRLKLLIAENYWHCSFTYSFAQFTHLCTAGATVRGQPHCTFTQKRVLILTQPWFPDRCSEATLRSLVSAGVLYLWFLSVCSSPFPLLAWSKLTHLWLMDAFSSLLVSSVYQFLGDFHVLSHGTYVSTLHPLFSGDSYSIHMCRSPGSPFRQTCAEGFSWQKQCC